MTGMRNVILFFAIILILNSCKKENVASNNLDNGLFCKKLYNELLFVKSNHRDVELKNNANPKFPANPYDYLGELHNEGLDYIYSHPNFKNDFEYLYPILVEFLTGKQSQCSKSCAQLIDEYTQLYNELKGNASIASPEMFLNLSFLSNTEKQIIYTYEFVAFSTSNLSLRIAMSKTTELFIKNSNLPFNAKAGLLMYFAVNRWSDKFWTNFNSNYADGSEVIPDLCPCCGFFAAGMDKAAIKKYSEYMLQGMMTPTELTGYVIGASLMATVMASLSGC